MIAFVGQTVQGCSSEKKTNKKKKDGAAGKEEGVTVFGDVDQTSKASTANVAAHTNASADKKEE